MSSSEDEAQVEAEVEDMESEEGEGAEEVEGEGEKEGEEVEVEEKDGREESQSADRKTLTPGVVYLSRVPPFMRPRKVRHLLSQYGTLGRVYLQPEGEGGTVVHCRNIHSTIERDSIGSRIEE